MVEESGGLAAALAAAGVDAETAPDFKAAVEGAAETAPQGSIGSGCGLQSVSPGEAEALVQLAEWGIGSSVRVYAAMRHVPWTPALAKTCGFSEPERKSLMLLAPAAVPYARKLLGAMPILGAVMFGANVALMAASRFEAVKASAPAPAGAAAGAAGAPKRKRGRPRKDSAPLGFSAAAPGAVEGGAEG